MGIYDWELADALSMAMLKSPYDDAGLMDEHTKIRKMLDVVASFNAGHMSDRKLVTILRNNPIPGWNWESWLQEMVDRDEYDEAILYAHPLEPGEPDERDE